MAVGLTPGGRSAMLPAPVRVLAVLFRVGVASAAGVMTGNRPAASPAAMTVVMVRFGVPVVLAKDPTDMHLSCVDVETGIAR